VTMKNAIFWDVAPCRSCVNRRFGRTYRLHLQGRRIRERGTSVSEQVAQSAATFSRWFLSRRFFYPEDGGIRVSESKFVVLCVGLCWSRFSIIFGKVFNKAILDSKTYLSVKGYPGLMFFHFSCACASARICCSSFVAQLKMSCAALHSGLHYIHPGKCHDGSLKCSCWTWFPKLPHVKSRHSWQYTAIFVVLRYRTVTIRANTDAGGDLDLASSVSSILFRLLHFYRNKYSTKYSRFRSICYCKVVGAPRSQTSVRHAHDNLHECPPSSHVTQAGAKLLYTGG
jgi:hypothetical protein